MHVPSILCIINASKAHYFTETRARLSSPIDSVGWRITLSPAVSTRPFSHWASVVPLSPQDWTCWLRRHLKPWPMRHQLPTSTVFPAVRSAPFYIPVSTFVLLLIRKQEINDFPQVQHSNSWQWKLIEFLWHVIIETIIKAGDSLWDPFGNPNKMAHFNHNGTGSW